MLTAAVLAAPIAVELGARAGLGYATGGASADWLASGYIPSSFRLDAALVALLGGDLGLRTSTGWFFGVHGAWAARSSGALRRFGVQAHVDLAPGATLVPWLGVGAAYESLAAGAGSEPSLQADTNVFRGFALDLQGGVDSRREGASLRWGPWAMVSIGRFGGFTHHAGQHIDRGSDYDVTPNGGVHGMVVVGVRAAFDL